MQQQPNALKAMAWRQLHRAVRSGTVIKPDRCEDCGKQARKPGDIHGHHEDYAQPLNVAWLCGQCHRDRHPECPPLGERHGATKLTNDQAREVLRRAKTGESQRLIALDFGISRQCVNDISTGKRWSAVLGPSFSGEEGTEG